MNHPQTWAPTVTAPATVWARLPSAVDGVAHAVTITWHEIDTVLTPVIGDWGVTSLFRHSLEEVCAEYPWLSATEVDDATLAQHLAHLTPTLLRQTPRDAAAACGRHLLTFYRSLGSLLGPQLAQQLQASARVRAAADPAGGDNNLTPPSPPSPPGGDHDSPMGALSRALRPLCCEALDLVQLIHQAVAAYGPVLADREQHFVLTLPAEPVLLSGNAVWMGQVLAHLFDNATKYTPVGGDVGVSLQVDAEHLSIAVWDSGIGIASDALDRIFEPYVREPRAARFANEGLGLGLTQAQTLAKSLGGELNAHSAGGGRGSCFLFTLPRAC